MQMQILLEKVEEGKFRATGGGLFSFMAEGATEDEATKNYREAVAARLINGGKLVDIELPTASAVHDHSWMKFVGTLPDDELTQEWMQSVDDHRREFDDEVLEQP